jgi:hypothetical protein
MDYALSSLASLFCVSPVAVAVCAAEEEKGVVAASVFLLPFTIATTIPTSTEEFFQLRRGFWYCIFAPPPPSKFGAYLFTRTTELRTDDGTTFVYVYISSPSCV